MGPRGARRKTPFGKWSETCRVNLDIEAGLRAAIYIVPEEMKEQRLIGEPGPDVFLGFTSPRDGVNINLSKLTHDELTALKEVTDMAFANAQQVVLQRDANAKEALQNGDDSYVRIYRRVPEIIIREGEKFKHYPLVRRGLDWSTRVASKYNTRLFKFRGTDEPVFELHPHEVKPGDDQQEDSDVSQFRQVPR